MQRKKLTKKQIYWIVVLLVLEGLLLFHLRVFLPSENEGSKKWLAVFFGLTLLIALSILRIWRSAGAEQGRGQRVRISPLEFLFVFAVFPASWHFTVELIENPAFREIDLPHHLLSIALCAALFLILFFLSQSLRFTLWFGSVFFFVFGGIQYYVIEFRGSPAVFGDFLDIGAAAAVGGEYSVQPGKKLLTVGVILLLLCFHVLYRGDRCPALGSKLRTAERIAAAAAAVLLVVGIANSGSFRKFVKLSYYTTTREFHRQGTVLAFIRSILDSRIEAPEGYDPALIRELADEYVPKAESYNAGLGGNVQPNILVIMDESFSNIDVTGKNGLAAEMLPNYLSLKENAVKGNAMVSTIAGGTARCEYEFNTNGTMHFFRQNLSPYVLFGKNMTFALASQMKEQGYYTAALHPYKRNSYARPGTYAAMGFDEYLSEEAFRDPEYLRYYVSDRSAFDKLTEIIKEKEEPAFLFEVTMQNHGPYQYEGFEPGLLVGDGSCPEANEFASVIRETDRALGELIETLRTCEEPTILVLFGDHLPSMPKEFYQSFNGFTRESPGAERLLYYQTPYVIWANYDIPEADGAVTSLNYLGVELLKLAGSKLTPYQMYLAELKERFPAFSKVGWCDSAGEQHRYGTDPGKESELDTCRYIIYNELIDKKHRCDDFYKIP